MCCGSSPSQPIPHIRSWQHNTDWPGGCQVHTPLQPDESTIYQPCPLRPHKEHLASGLSPIAQWWSRDPGARLHRQSGQVQRKVSNHAWIQNITWARPLHQTHNTFIPIGINETWHMKHASHEHVTWHALLVRTCMRQQRNTYACVRWPVLRWSPNTIFLHISSSSHARTALKVYI